MTIENRANSLRAYGEQLARAEAELAQQRAALETEYAQWEAEIALLKSKVTKVLGLAINKNFAVSITEEIFSNDPLPNGAKEN